MCKVTHTPNLIYKQSSTDQIICEDTFKWVVLGSIKFSPLKCHIKITFFLFKKITFNLFCNLLLIKFGLFSMSFSSTLWSHKHKMAKNMFYYLEKNIHTLEISNIHHYYQNSKLHYITLSNRQHDSITPLWSFYLPSFLPPPNPPPRTPPT